MESLLERTARVLDLHPAPALPLGELRRLVRGSGVVVGEEALLGALVRGADRLRVVDPWRGPWSGLLGTRQGRSAGAHAGRGWARARTAAGGRAVADRAEASPAPLPGLGARWVVARPAEGSGRHEEDRVLRRLRQSVAHLGWNVDGGSPSDLTRWRRLVGEAGRLRERARGGRGGPPSPVTPF